MAIKKLTNDDDTQLFGDGIDQVDGLKGNDILDGGLGNDLLLGNVGNDFLAGGGGTDTLKGDSGDDVLDGGSENDQLYGGTGSDILHGGTGADQLRGEAGDDYLSGGAGNDTLYGGSGSDSMDGGDGNDTLYDATDAKTYGTVSTENDEMVGGAGNDKFFGGYDTMWGGDGNDTFTVNNQGIVYGGIGNDTITVKNANASLGSWLEGGLGNDVISGGAGNDTLFSGYGADALNGGNGDDSYVITFDDFVNDDGTGPGVGVDKISDTGGSDTIFYIRDFSGTNADGRDDDVGLDGKELDPVLKFNDYYVTMPNGIENGVLDDQVYVNNPNQQTYFVAHMTGNTLDNKLTGSNLDDVIDGGAGKDTIKAGDGDDWVYVGQGSDVVDGGAGIDTILSSVDFNLANQSTRFENLVLLNSAKAVNANGDAGGNWLVGNLYDNVLQGGVGNDILDGWFDSHNKFEVVLDTAKTTGNDTYYGGVGDDTYRIDSGNDITKEIAGTRGGNDTVEFNGTVATDSYTLLDGVDNLKIVNNLREGVGNNLNNRIFGNSSNNNLIGLYGDDYLDGGTGLDSFAGGYGDDTYVVDSVSEFITEKSGQGDDWVQSASISLDLNTSAWGGSIENGKLTGTTNGLNLFGSVVDNVLIGNDGANVLDGREGVDTLQGGLGNDTYVVDTLTDTLLEVANVFDATKGTIKDGYIDTIQSSINFSLNSDAYKNFENLTLLGNTAKTATGNLNDNYLLGNDVANTLTGLDGNDILDGAGGLDTLIGGAGNDTYKLGNDDDIVTELANGGIDTIESTKTLNLGNFNNIENLTLVGDAAAGIGTKSGNILIGDNIANTLTGLDGNDTLKGGEDADTLIGGKGADVYDLAESLAKTDTVKIAIGDTANSSGITGASDADRIVRFDLSSDVLDLANTKIAANAPSVDGKDEGGFNSHSITNGIIKFDDIDTYTSPVTIAANNISGAVDYLKANITDGSTVAFLGYAADPTTAAQVYSTWVFQDNGASDTLVALIGVTTATSLTLGVSSTGIHLV